MIDDSESIFFFFCSSEFTNIELPLPEIIIWEWYQGAEGEI